jgi:hypothetical protein
MQFRQGTALTMLLSVVLSGTLARSMDGVAAQAPFTEQISVSGTGTGGNVLSRDAAISADGRFVGFISGASNLVAGDTNTSANLFVRDRQAGTTERIALPAGVTDPTGPLSISGDGRFVVFAANGPEPDVLNIITHVYLHDRATGINEKISTTLANHRGSFLPVSKREPIPRQSRGH